MDWLQRLASPAKAPTAIPPVPAHPFYPIGVEVTNYAVNKTDMLVLVTGFFSGWALLLGATWLLTTRYAPQVQILDKSILIWFVLTGTIHLWFEGYFAYNHTRMASAQDLFGQLWKEYSLSDSRYMFSDPFVLCMETVTAVCWGPLSYLTAALIAKSHPLRYPLQAIVSLGQIYGDVLYFATSFFDLYYKNLSYCRPEGYYFWFYFVFLNMIWIVVPGMLLYQSVSKTVEAFHALDRIGQVYTGNGAAKVPKSSKVNGRVKQ